MKKIDLTKEYPHLDATYTDYPVSSDVYAVFEQSRLDEQAQAKRLYLYYFSGMTLEEIAHIEGVSKVAIHKSIQLGKANLKKILSNAFL